jgi:hypothetical protein
MPSVAESVLGAHLYETFLIEQHKKVRGWHLLHRLAICMSSNPLQNLRVFRPGCGAHLYETFLIEQHKKVRVDIAEHLFAVLSLSIKHWVIAGSTTVRDVSD